MDRREFLKMLGIAGLSGVGSFACAPTLLRTNTETGLSLGYVCGEVTDQSALVWLRAERDSRTAIQYGKDPSFDRFILTELVSVDPDADATAIIPLDDLEPGTRYYYRALVSGKKPGPIASFVTAPRPDEHAKVSFCFSGDTRDNYQPFTIMSAVQAQRPDFFMHLGDTIYADINGRARQLSEFWAKYRRNRADAWGQNCFCATSVYAIWDDHEVVNYRSFRWGRAAEIFLLDARQYRNHAKNTMLGRAQKRWLFDALSASSATFKFIASAVPLAGGGHDRWDGFPQERAEIIEFIRSRKITGVVFLSADMHYAAITKIPNSGGLRDITAGPLAAPLNRVTNGTAARYEFFMAENFNFAKITIDPKINSRKALVEFIDQDNQVFHTANVWVA
jgi:alkaline phosphatase D